jgi:segregation and condensation protein A
VKQKQEYSVKLDVFEGPLDLLLYLVLKAEVDIAQISVSEVARQYLAYLDMMRELNIELASEYLSMAATLTRLKAHEVLGIDDGAQGEFADGDDILTRQQLIDKLLEYKKFKEAAGSLRVHETERFGSVPRGRAEEVEVAGDTERAGLESVSIFDLISAFQRIMQRATDTEENQRVIAPETVRLDDRIEHVLGMLHDGREVPFEELFADDLRKLVCIVTFMAILELVKMQKLSLRQEQMFGTIFVKGRVEISDA